MTKKLLKELFQETIENCGHLNCYIPVQEILGNYNKENMINKVIKEGFVEKRKNGYYLTDNGKHAIQKY